MKTLRFLNSSGDRTVFFDDSEAMAEARAEAQRLFERSLAAGAVAFSVNRKDGKTDQKVTDFSALEDETVVSTILWYLPLVAGPDRVAITLGGVLQGETTQAIENGCMLSFLVPDWRSFYFQKYAKKVGGKMALMLLPAAVPGGRRSSVTGGIMLSITKKSVRDDPDKFNKAWELATYLCYDMEGRATMFAENNMVPPVREAWNHPVYGEPNPYWSNQPVGKIYAAASEQAPVYRINPYNALAKSKLNDVLISSTAYYDAHGKDGVEKYVRDMLKQAADDIRLQMAMNPYH